MTDNDLASEIRTALEGTTPGPWEWGRKDYTLDGPDGVTVLYAENNVMWWDNAQDGALIAAAPELLARAADRIEALEHALTALKRALTAVGPQRIVDEAVAEFIAKEGA